MVFTPTGRCKNISDVMIGDLVLTTCGFSSVYLLAHTDHNTSSTFIEIMTDSQHLVQLTPLHYIRANGAFKLAKDVQSSDRVMVGIQNSTGFNTGQLFVNANVTRVRTVTKQGLHSPFTMCGDIVVSSTGTCSSGVVASVYSDWFLESSVLEVAVIPVIYHYLTVLAPLRGIFAIFPAWTKHFAMSFDGSKISIHEHGYRKLAIACWRATRSMFAEKSC